MKTDEFEFVETVNALSLVIGLAISSASQEVQAAFIGRLEGLIAASEAGSIRWRTYRQILRDVSGQVSEEGKEHY